MEVEVKELEPPTFETLQRLIAILRGEQGCPWDRKQTPITLSVYLIEEIYELVDAIASDDTKAILEELGDVLFQVFFTAYIYEQDHRFSFPQVLQKIIGKMIHRHPHVFGSEKVETTGEVKKQWQRIKQEEKGKQHSLLDSIPAGMPALMRAYRISERAAGTGFDWDTLSGVMHQVEQEWAEFSAEVKDAPTGEKAKAKATMEFGDVLFTMVNAARLAGIHPETALSRSTQKFIKRFKYMEARAAGSHMRLESMPRDEMERLWQAAKESERKDGL